MPAAAEYDPGSWGPLLDGLWPTSPNPLEVFGPSRGRAPAGGDGIEPTVMPPVRCVGEGGGAEPWDQDRRTGPAPEWGRQKPVSRGSAAPIRGLARGVARVVPRFRAHAAGRREASPGALFRRPHSGAVTGIVWSIQPRPPRSGARLEAARARGGLPLTPHPSARIVAGFTMSDPARPTSPIRRAVKSTAWRHQRTSESSKSRVSSASPAARGESLVTRCWGRVPWTSAGTSSRL